MSLTLELIWASSDVIWALQKNYSEEFNTSELALSWLCSKAFPMIRVLTLILTTLQSHPQSQWKESWARKYTRKSVGLPLSQVQRLGRQVLEALLFLRDRGIPSHGHLHSGNVILQNGVARYGISLRAPGLVNRYSICYILISLSFAPTLSSTG